MKREQEKILTIDQLWNIKKYFMKREQQPLRYARNSPIFKGTVSCSQVESFRNRLMRSMKWEQQPLSYVRNHIQMKEQFLTCILRVQY